MRAALALSLAAAFAAFGCGGNATSTSSGSNPPASFDNTQPIAVTSGPDGNEVDTVYTSVTICVPGTTQCQTIPDIAVDTGSVGLRIVASALTLTLPQVNGPNGAPLASCASFADMSYVWGPMKTADIQMADEKAAAVPIHLIGAPGFPDAPSACSGGGTAENTAAALGANGLLGVGVFRQDCGPACTTVADTGFYFTCPASGCVASTAPLASQLPNPVWLFPQDNNGFVLSLPGVPDAGAPTVSGSMIFGIGTRPNNGLGSATVFTTDDVGNFRTVFGGATYSNSYLDSGSNGFFFSSAKALGLPECGGRDSDFYCPAGTQAYSATTIGSNNASASVAFKVASADALFATPNFVFSDLAGPSTDFDWGLPFFLGRNVAIGIEGQAAGSNVGPYWAY